MALSFKVYSRDATGFTDGSYSAYLLKGARLELEGSILEGSSLKITSTQNIMDIGIHKVRPVRLFKDGTKIFDGCIRAPEYRNNSNNFRDLTVKARGWEAELADIDLQAVTGGTGVDFLNASLDTIFTRLANYGNNFGCAKKQLYKYDTSKLPYWDATVFGNASSSITGLISMTDGSRDVTGSGTSFFTNVFIGDYIKIDAHSDSAWEKVVNVISDTALTLRRVYTGGTGVDAAGSKAGGITKLFSGSIMDGLLDMTRILDFRETDHIGEWAIKIDALQSDYYIYIIPMMMNDDQAVTSTFKDFKLMPPKFIWKDYSKLVNSLSVHGDGDLITQMISSTPLLATTSITSNDFRVDATAQPSARNYLKITITNPAASQDQGSIKINGSDGLSTPINERFFLYIPANSSAERFTDNRFATLEIVAWDGINSFETVSLSGCTIKVEECINGIAGRSINLFGPKIRMEQISDIKRQIEVNSYSSGIVRVNHAPLINIEAIIKNKFHTTTDLVGKTINLYDNFLGAQADFFCTKQTRKFNGLYEEMTLSATRLNYDWEYTE